MTTPTLAVAADPTADTDCPPWCDKTCQNDPGDIQFTRLHIQSDEVVAGSPDSKGNPSTASMGLLRDDNDDAPDGVFISLAVSSQNQDVRLSMAQARQLAAALLNLIDLGDPGGAR